MEIAQIKNILRKKATLFQTGGKRPDLSINESWIGKIPYSLPNETYPIDRYQEKMYAIMMLNLTQIPFVPEASSKRHESHRSVSFSKFCKRLIQPIRKFLY